MSAILLECPICKRVYSVEGMSEKDGHICICGQILDKQANYIGFCENASAPNNPLHICHGDNSPERVPPKKLTKTVTIDVKTGKGFNKLLKNIEELRESIKDIPGLVMIDNNGKVNAVPVISIDSKALIFQSDVLLTNSYKKDFEKEYTERTGIECIMLDGKAKLAAVIDG